MTAEAVLKAMLSRYSALKSYQDRGIVLRTWPDKAEPYEISFTTFFRRPDLFRFDWISHHPYPPLRHLKTRHVIWSDGKDALHYTIDKDSSKMKRKESLFMAVAGATGISMGSALTVFNMLMPEYGARSFTELRDIDLRTAVFEGIDCHCIRGRYAQGAQEDLRIGANDHLLRCVSSSRGEGAIAQEIRREIRINEPINDDVFQFRPDQ